MASNLLVGRNRSVVVGHCGEGCLALAVCAADCWVGTCRLIHDSSRGFRMRRRRIVFKALIDAVKSRKIVELRVQSRAVVVPSCG